MTAEPKPLIVAIVGPTAAGKTDLGASLAQTFDGEVVSADSMQIYKGLDIATAKPSPERTLGVPHHLISVLEPWESCSVARYTQMAREVLEQILARGRLPFVVGGTGLYLDALLDNIRFPQIPSDENLRAKLTREAQTHGGEVLLERLRACDPAAAQRLHPNNIKRVVRALEVYELTGIPLSEHERRSREEPPPWETLRLGLDFRDRSKLYERIRARVDEMVRNGLCEEVLGEIRSGVRRSTSAAAIGYKELLPWAFGAEHLEDALERVKRQTCRYAKRQGTWFRRNHQIQWAYVDDFCGDYGIFEKFRDSIAKQRPTVL